jgi:hypothetical protein
MNMDFTQKIIWDDFILFDKVHERVDKLLHEGKHVIAVLGGKFAICGSFEPTYLDSKRLTEDAIECALQIIEESNFCLPEVDPEVDPEVGGDRVFCFIVCLICASIAAMILLSRKE